MRDHRRMDALRGRRRAQPDEPIFDQGLAFDLESVLINRRRVLRLMGQAGLAVGVAACAPASVLLPSPTATSGSTVTSGATTGAADCDVRSDISSSFGSSSWTAEGVPLSITLAIGDAAKNCTVLAGAKGATDRSIERASRRVIAWRRPNWANGIRGSRHSLSMVSARTDR